MGRAKSYRDPRQAGDRLDDADQLRRPEHPAELTKPRGEIRDPHGAAVAVGEHGRDNSRVAQVVRLAVDHLVEHHVGKTLFLVAGQQPAESRIGVESGKAPPDNAG